MGTFRSVINIVNLRSHVIGVAANYSEEYYTQSVFRLEASLDYWFSNHIMLRFTQDFYWRLSSHDPGPWSIGDRFARPRDSRHETILSVIFQF